MASIEVGGVIGTGSIVVAVDGSQHGDRAVAWAAEEARLRHLPLAIVHAEPALGFLERGSLAKAGIPLANIMRELRADSEELLGIARDTAERTAPAVRTDLVLREGDAREVLLELAPSASMTVVGSRGLGPVTSLLLGSVSLAVSRHAECPVVVVRPPVDAPRHGGVLVGTDGTGHSSPTLETAFQEASSRGLSLRVVHCRWEAWSGPGGWRVARTDDPFYEEALVRVTRLLTALEDKFPDVPVEVEIFAGHADQCVADLSREHDLTVVGRHARTLLARVGPLSLTSAIVEHACGPVLVVP